MYIGVDIGGTKIRGGLLDMKYRIVKTAEHPTQARHGRAQVISNILHLINELKHPSVKGVGLAIRGLVDHDKGQVIESTMLPGRFKDVPLAKLVSQRCGYKVKLDNDVRCFTLAEAILGVGQGKQRVIGLALGTGIGGGIVINNKLERGSQGAAGEFGHMIIRPDSYKWNCGQKGCLESLCSGTASVYRYKLKTGRQLKSLEIEDRFKAGEKAASQVYSAMSQDLSIGLANIIQTLNPDMIVIGGGFGKLKFYVDPAIKQVKQHLIYQQLKQTPIRYAKFTKEAGFIGAALLLKEK